MSTLAAEIRSLIAAEGPLPLARYMALALGHPVHGYYVARDPIGRHGDFTTAPEVSQMFGEMLGAWAAHLWRAMGAPASVALVELGPGRGTLMADALRALRVVPELSAALTVHLVETSPVLRARQRDTLAAAGVPIVWHETVADVPQGPLIVLANEFLDALPLHQYEKRAGRWHERVVGLSEGGALTLGLAPDAVPETLIAARFRAALDGSIFERAPAREAVAAEVAQRLARAPGAALFVDYGHARSGLGDTFQAVRGHAYADPFADPGEADLTSHVDFEAIASAARHGGAEVHGPIGQGAFLLRLGIAERARRLAAGKDAGTARDIAAALDRLTSAEGMGTLFQALALTAPGLTAPPFA
jgi:SAM-dependent MidA family methyltransferase